MFVAVEGAFSGMISVSDPVKASTPDALNALHALGLTIIIASGDNERTARAVAARIGIDNIRKKSLKQTTRIMQICDEAGYQVNTPREAHQRGGTVCFDFPGSDKVAKALNAQMFLCDHRPQSGIRVSPHFYSSDEEVERFMAEVARLRKAI